MPDIKQLPSLLRLLDDDSEVVRQAVLRELIAYGPNLGSQLDLLSPPADDDARGRLDDILASHRRRQIAAQWPEWFGLRPDPRRLEAALSALADFLNGFRSTANLTSRLDALAAEYAQERGRAPDPHTLAHFLFKLKGLEGAEQDFYNPQHSNPVYAIEQKRGLPITLVCIYMLVGSRVGIRISGCNMPGRFLARIDDASGALVDCSAGGRILRESDLMSSGAPAASDVLKAKVTPEAIVARILSNLVNAYQRKGPSENVRLMNVLLETLENSARKERLK